MDKKNCWEFTGCGRQEGGARAAELGICPAGQEARAGGPNGGLGSGRYCWRVVGTYCDDEEQHDLRTKMRRCPACGFMKRVQEEEGAEFRI